MENGKIPAFQTSIGMSNSEMKQMGLTKREYFAVHIATGLSVQAIEGSQDNIERDVPCIAVRIADALLKELENTK